MRKNEAEMINAEGAKPIDWGVLMLAVHQPLTGIFGVVNGAAYPITQAISRSGHNEVLAAIGIAAFLGNFALQYDTYRRTNVTPNLTAMFVREKFHIENVLGPMILGYLANTLFQIGVTPVAIWKMIVERDFDHLISDSLPPQLIAGFVASLCGSILIRSGWLKPVADKLGDFRKNRDERVEAALNHIGEHHLLGRYDE